MRTQHCIHTQTNYFNLNRSWFGFVSSFINTIRNTWYIKTFVYCACIFNVLILFFKNLKKKLKFNDKKTPCMCGTRFVRRKKFGWYHLCFDKLHVYQKAFVWLKIWDHTYDDARQPGSYTALSGGFVLDWQRTSFCSATLVLVKIDNYIEEYQWQQWNIASRSWVSKIWLSAETKQSW